jgi:ATP-dependent Lon protease
MTGEVTLTGQVLPIGGVREKVLAAQRAGVSTVVLPSENEPDLEDLPAETRKGLEFVLAEHVDEVLETALDGAVPSRRPSGVGSPERKAALPAEF